MSSMLRQSSTRNQRNKGFKVKHVLQVCVIIAVSVWLIYQLKQSHHDNKAMEQATSMLSIDKTISEMFRFGRKGLDPSPVAAAQADGNMETHNGNEDTGNEHAEQLVKPQVQPQENENVREGEEEDEEENEARDGGQELGDEEQLDHGDGSGDEEENEDKSAQHAKETEATTQVAREENYKGDDASSAVVHSDEEHTEIVDKDAEVHNESGVSMLMPKVTAVNQTSLLEMEHEGDSTVNSTIPETRNPVEQEEEQKQEQEQEQEQEEEQKESNPNTSFVEKMEHEGDSTVNSTMPETSIPVEQEEQKTVQEQEQEQEQKKEQEQEQEQEEEQKTVQEQEQEQEEEQRKEQEQEEEQKKEQEQKQEQEEEEKESNPNTSFVEEMEHEDGGSIVDNSTTTMSEFSNSTLEKSSIADPTNSTMGRESGMEDGESKSENIVIEQTVKSNAETTDDGGEAVEMERSESMSKDYTVANEEERDPKIPNGNAVEQVSNDAGESIVSENGGEHEPNDDASSKGDAIITREEKDALTDLSTLPDILTDEMKVEDISAE